MPELHNFVYIASLSWLRNSAKQQDWIDSITLLESWLTQHIGEQYADWTYTRPKDAHYDLAYITFRLDKYRTLFLLR